MKFRVLGGNRLEGCLETSGAKNAVLPLMAASMLTNEPVILNNIPNITDISAMESILRGFGSETIRSDNGVFIRNERITRTSADYEQASRIRASVLVMGPLLARLGMVSMPLPGGCAIGSRPLDLHIKGFRALGASIEFSGGYIRARAPKLRGADVYLDFPSVGATENIMMAAVLADGVSIIRNAAAEPEITDTANMLNLMGAKITGAGTDTIVITGVQTLRGIKYSPIPDRIEAGTFIVAAAVAGGDVTVKNIIPPHISPVMAKLAEAGVTVCVSDNSARIISDGSLKPISIKSMPFPGFPTDMQAQMCALACYADGTSVISEAVFENRFNHCNELMRMGARIKLEDRTAIIQGRALTPACVTACDLRAGAALIIAALRAKGETRIANIEYIDRGYESIDRKLRLLGAEIMRIY